MKLFSPLFFFFKIILLKCIFDCPGSSLLCGLFSSCDEQGLLSSCGSQASHCSGLWASVIAQWVKSPPAKQETLEKG